jgi:CRP-like cAMP-binding protein
MPRSAPVPPEPRQNGLLAALPAGVYDELVAHLEPVPLTAHTVLYQPGQPVTHLYFPVSGVVCLLTVLSVGRAVEVGLVGREGAVGLAACLGRGRSSGRCLVQVAGRAFRLSAKKIAGLGGTGDLLLRVLLRYSHCLLSQVSQSVACMALHPVEQRLCRWLLMMRDRAGRDHFPLTHRFVADMLAVRRASVSEVAGRLQQRGLIRYGRGRLTLLDRPGLERAACECHRVIRAEWAHLFD